MHDQRDRLLRLLPSGDALSRLRAADAVAIAARQLVRELALDAHDAGATWTEIGAVLGVSAATAHERFSLRNARAARRRHRQR